MLLSLVSETGLVSGRVIDAASNAGIPGANVVVVSTRAPLPGGGQAGVSTGESGGFVLGPLRAGNQVLVASHVAYRAETLVVAVPERGVARPVFRLEPAVIPVPEVKVESRRKSRGAEVTVRELSGEDLRKRAGGFVQDPVRSLAFLPGVAHSSRGEWSGTYVVRGGDTDEGAVYFDNAELIWPYHLLGFSSVINPDLVGRVSFFPSVLPVRYGGAVSSVAVVEPRSPDNGQGFWAYDPMNVKAAYVGSLDDLEVLASVRRSFYYVVFGPMGAGRYNRPSFSDLALRFGLPVGKSHRVQAVLVSGADRVVSSLWEVEEEMSESGSTLSFGVESELGWAQSDLRAYWSRHGFTLEPAPWAGAASASQQEAGLRFDLSWSLGRLASVDLGLEAGEAGFQGNLLERSGFERSDRHGAGYVNVGFAPGAGFGLDLGLRCEDVKWSADRVVEPRVVASYAVGGTPQSGTPQSGTPQSPAVLLKAGYRRHHQHSYSFLRQSCASLVFENDYDGYRLFEAGALGAKQADHLSIAGEVRLWKRTGVAVEGYVKSYSGLPTWRETKDGELYGFGNEGKGLGRGVELQLVQDPVAGWSGNLSYGLSWCRKQQGTDTMTYWDKYDRRHALNLVGEKAFGESWSLTATFHFHTGSPYTPLYYSHAPGAVGGSDLNRGPSPFVFAGERNSARVPGYHRLDLKLTKELPKLPLHPHFYLEILNVYNQQNVYHLVQAEARDGTVYTATSVGIPFMPLVGIGGRF